MLRTTLNVMKWTVAKRLLRDAVLNPTLDAALANSLAEELGTELTVASINSYMHGIADDEKANTLRGVECWRADSRIGFEATMEYAFDDRCAAYKLELLEKSLGALDKACEIKPQ